MRKQILSTKTMLYYEDWIKSVEGKDITSFDDYEKLPEELNLKVEYVNDNSMSPNTEAELCPPEQGSPYMGIIRIKEMYKGTKFAYMHEIVHYLKDVGVGNIVNETFSRNIKGKTTDIHEQEINYATAAVIMKIENIRADIEEYDRQKFFIDELAFLDTLCKRYGQDKEAIFRRIREVRRLMQTS